jgi:hypothetical protein
MVEVVGEIEKEDVPGLRKQLAEVEMWGEIVGKEKMSDVEEPLRVLLQAHRVRLLEIGAPGRLMVSEELAGVLPLEDGHLLAAARPITPEGKVRLDPVKVQAREDAMLKAALAMRPVAVIVLGGAHDLSGSVRRLAPGSDYLRVTMEGCPP